MREKPVIEVLTDRSTVTESNGKLSNLSIRLLTAAVAVPILLGLLYRFPKWGFLAVVLVAGMIAAAELMAMTVRGSKLLQMWGVGLTGFVIGLILFGPSEVVFSAVIGALVVTLLLSVWINAESIETAAPRIGWVVFAPVYVGCLLSTLGLLHQRDHGGSWVVLSMMLAWFGDTGGYFGGRFFGKRPLCERISPKKTVEGLVGSLIASLTGGLVAHFFYLPELSLAGAIFLGLVVGGIGQAGDLFESLIKRGAGAKDSGRIVPGHGGLLDRIDGLLFTSAGTWLFSVWSPF